MKSNKLESTTNSIVQLSKSESKEVTRLCSIARESGATTEALHPAVYDATEVFESIIGGVDVQRVEDIPSAQAELRSEIAGEIRKKGLREQIRFLVKQNYAGIERDLLKAAKPKTKT